MKKFQNKYRISSARAVWWDYSEPGAYFITICTGHREHSFGEIKIGKMILSSIGEIAQQCWFDIPNHFPHVKLGVFVVMPNHIHGIIHILVETMHASSSDNPVTIASSSEIDNNKNVASSNDINDNLNNNESTETTDKPINEKMASISPKPGSLARILGSYKSAITKLAHLINPAFDWQERYHDHIIRDMAEYNRIENYIIHNPENWKEDCFNKPEI